MLPSEGYVPAPQLVRLSSLTPARQLRHLIAFEASFFSGPKSKSLPKRVNTLALTLAELQRGLAQAFAGLRDALVVECMASENRGALLTRYDALGNEVRDLLQGDDEEAVREKMVVVVMMRWASEELVEKLRKQKKEEIARGVEAEVGAMADPTLEQIRGAFGDRFITTFGLLGAGTRRGAVG